MLAAARLHPPSGWRRAGGGGGQETSKMPTNAVALAWSERTPTDKQVHLSAASARRRVLAYCGHKTKQQRSYQLTPYATGGGTDSQFTKYAGLDITCLATRRPAAMGAVWTHGIPPPRHRTCRVAGAGSPAVGLPAETTGVLSPHAVVAGVPGRKRQSASSLRHTDAQPVSRHKPCE